MENIIKITTKKGLNIPKPWATFFGMGEAIVLSLMLDKFAKSVEEGREFKLPKREYSSFITYHSFKKACNYFESIGLLRLYDDVNGVQAGVSYKINPKKFDEICKITILCDILYDYESLIKEYIKEDFSIRDIEQAIK